MIDLRSVLPYNQFPKDRDLIHALVTTCSYGNLAHHKVAEGRQARKVQTDVRRARSGREVYREILSFGGTEGKRK